MIAGCPKCAARYRIDTAKLRPEGARLRCARCESVFRVQPPREEAAASGPASRPLPSGRREPSAPAPEPAAPSERGVLIAHPDAREGKAIADAVARWGAPAAVVGDGVEAILQIQRTLPRAVVLDAALPKMFGFQVCELMKRNEQLRSIPVVLVGAIHDENRYRRPPGDLYGADAYVERQELPDALEGLLARFGLAAPSAPAPPPPSAPAPTPAAPPAPAAPPERAPAPAAEAPAGPQDEERAKGERLARIIVSDVILYNAEKFEAALRAGNVVEALADELQEGYALFSQRVDTSVCDPREYLHRELQRVADARGGG